MTRLQIFCDIDDFCLWFVPVWESRMLPPADHKVRRRSGRLCLSEIMTILVLFHRSNYRTFKHFYQEFVLATLQDEFPGLVSYSRFVELIPGTVVPFCAYLQQRKGAVTGIAFVDSTPVKVCHNRRISSHKVFQEVARRGKCSLGWFYGFKVHLIVNDQGELLAVRITPGNVDDRVPVPDMTTGLYGKLFGDRGYISQKLFDHLYARGLQLITKLKRKMHNRLMSVVDKLLLRKRAIIEAINDQLKNISQIEHTRHRSVPNAMVNILAGIIAYTYQDKLPSLNLTSTAVKELAALQAGNSSEVLPMAAF
ncbi:MAG: IS982 family transposase [Alphaproteobacteria bacterium]|jgi:hypothetical protein